MIGIFLINETPSTFFKGNIGIRQGCPLSPYLFILAIKGLGRLALDAKGKGIFSRIKVSRTLFITHILYVDDILIFGDRKLDGCQHLKDIIDIFYGALGMKISLHKSSFSFSCQDQLIIDSISHMFPYKLEVLDLSIKHLGLYLKPNAYKKEIGVGY